MLANTRGIVLNYVKYRETSIITKIYTEAFGVLSFIENGVRSAKSKQKIALFQPLTLLDLVVYHKAGKDIQRLAELKCNQPYQAMPYQIAKSSVGIFLVEILGKTLREEDANAALFDFLWESLLWFDAVATHFENFHLQFLLQLSGFLGFLPETSPEMLEELQLHGWVSSEPSAALLLQLLLDTTYENSPQLTRSQRNAILDIILQWYRLHIDTLGEIKSLAVLKEVLS